MEAEFWLQRWRENQIGFHLDNVNPYLIKHWRDLKLDGNSTVFVPLCGKSLDLIWLAKQGYHVIGVECSEMAIQAFFDEQKLAFQRDVYKGYKVFNAQNITLLQGDYFHMDKELLQDVAAVYDRASLVAMPPSMRDRYVQTMRRCLPLSSRIMLIVLDYDQQKMAGPPFAVSEDEVRRLYSPHYRIELLHQRDVIAEEARFRERGIDSMLESVYLLEAESAHSKSAAKVDDAV